MRLKRAVTVVGIGGGILVGIVALAALYVHLTWDRDRYGSYPLPDLRATTDTALIARGRYLALGPANCVGCHTVPGAPPLSGGVAFPFPLGTLYTTGSPDTN